MSLSSDIRSIPELFGDAIAQLGKLVQNEAQLARAEISQKITQAKIGAGYLVAAAIFMIPVIAMLLFTLALWLIERGFSPIEAHLIVAGAGGLISIGLILIGMSYLTPTNLTPNVTMQQLERDVKVTKEMAK
jgi:hypothetical protein